MELSYLLNPNRMNSLSWQKNSNKIEFRRHSINERRIITQIEITSLSLQLLLKHIA